MINYLGRICNRKIAKRLAEKFPLKNQWLFFSLSQQ